MGVSHLKPHPPLVLDASEREAVMVCAGECVREEEVERKRRETRTELVKQLEELELSERKDLMKVSHCGRQLTAPSTCISSSPS